MDILASLRPFLLLSNFFGLLPYGLLKTGNGHVLVKSKRRHTYSVVLFIVITTTYVYAEVNNLKLFRVPKAIQLFQRCVVTLTYYAFYMNAIAIFVAVGSKSDLLRVWLNNMNRLCRCEAFDINHDSLVTFNRYMLLLSLFQFLCLVAASLVSYYFFYHPFGFNTTSERFARFIFFTSLGLINLFLKHFMIFTNIVRLFYKKVNTDLANRGRAKWRRFYMMTILRQIQSADLTVKDFVDVLQTVYMKAIYASLIWAFLTILHSLISGMTTTSSALAATWTMYIFMEAVGLAIFCHLTSTEAEKTGHYIHELFVEHCDSEVEERVEILSLQLQHRKVEFSVCGFFKLDFTLVYSMIGTITTYIMILLQFQRQEFVPKEWRSKNATDCSILLSHFAAHDIIHCINSMKS